MGGLFLLGCLAPTITAFWPHIIIVDILGHLMDPACVGGQLQVYGLVDGVGSFMSEDS
jgi:hypothetical protein